MKKQDVSRPLARLSVQSRRDLLPAITFFVREIALRNGLDEQAAQRLELITEEAALNIIQHAFAGREDRFYDLIVHRAPSRFILALEDDGLPFDWEKAEKGEATGFGMLFMKAFADEVRFINLGKGGKRIEFIKDLAAGEVGSAPPGEAGEPDEKDGPPKSDAPLSFRLLTAEDGVRLARCMYQVYGYTYKDVIYFPEKVREMVQSGRLVSMVAVTPEGEIAGHQGLLKETPESRVAEVTMGVVDPRFRGRGLFEKLKELSFAHIRKTGVYGLYVEAVTMHAYSQKANRALGARETGILLGFVPSERVFVAINEQETRQTVVLLYTHLDPAPERTVYLPPHHRSILRKIYENGGFRRTEAAIPENAEDQLPEKSALSIQAVCDTGVAYLKVGSFGADFAKRIRFHLKEFCLGRIDCIFVDLPLSDPATPLFCSQLEYLGFFMTGIIPEVADGDVLRLEYLNNVRIDPEKIVLVSDFAKELFAYVWACSGEG